MSPVRDSEVDDRMLYTVPSLWLLNKLHSVNEASR